MTNIDLAKKKVIDLSKVAENVIQSRGLAGEKVQVKVAYDISGSMVNTYTNGTMQNVSDRLLGLAMQFDEDKSIDLFVFNSQSKAIDTVNLNNFYGLVENKISRLVSGGTNYAPVMKQILFESGIVIKDQPEEPKEERKGFMGLFGKKKEVQVQQPSTLFKDEIVYVIFITDGDNFDKQETENIVKESAKYNVFWKFVGIGSEKFHFLEHLDDMEGRLVDNTNFIKIKDIQNIQDEELYTMLLKEFPEWLKEAREKGIIVSK